MKTVGILGAGQLGCMLAESIYNYGHKVSFYDENSSPGFHRSSTFIQGSWSDREKLHDFFSRCDVITYEFENVATDLLEEIVYETKTPLLPYSDVLKLTQNRIFEKSFLKKEALPVCSFEAIEHFVLLQESAQKWTYPYIIKTATGGYDGKGQWFISCENDLIACLNDCKNFFAKKTFIIEEAIDINYEASCIIARDKNGKIIHFPIFENEHRHHILYNTIVPTKLAQNLQQQMIDISIFAAEKLNVIGLLTTEFFVGKSKNNPKLAVFVNEFAPRPHNSGHVTRNACHLSQFDAHARVLLDIPLQPPKLRNGFYCMGNLLGETWQAQRQTDTLNLSMLSYCPNVIDVMTYGKTESQKHRKMGHFVTCAENPTEAITAADDFRRRLNGEN